MKKYIFFDGPLYKRLGGPSTYLYNLKQEIEKTQRNDIIFIYSGDGEFKNKKKGIKDTIKSILTIYPPLLEKVLMMQKKRRKPIFKRLKEIHPGDVVMFHTTKDFAKASRLLPECCIKILMSHSPEVSAQEEAKNLKVKFPKYNFSYTENTYYEKFDLVAFQNADVIVFPSKEAMEPYQKTMPDFNKIIKHKTIKYILTGTEKLTFKMAKIDFRKKYNIPESAFIITFIGRHISIKGYDNFIRICSEIIDKYDNVYVVTAGVGNISSPKHSRWIDIGWTNDPGSIVNAANLFILPNKQTYFDLVLLEMMSLGKVGLVSNTGGNKTMAKFSDGIITYDSVADAIKKFDELYQNPKKLSDLEKKNLEVYKKAFTVRKFCERYLDFFDSLEKKD